MVKYLKKFSRWVDSSDGGYMVNEQIEFTNDRDLLLDPRRGEEEIYRMERVSVEDFFSTSLIKPMKEDSSNG